MCSRILNANQCGSFGEVEKGELRASFLEAPLGIASAASHHALVGGPLPESHFLCWVAAATDGDDVSNRCTECKLFLLFTLLTYTI